MKQREIGSEEEPCSRHIPRENPGSATLSSISHQHPVPFEGNYQINFGPGGFSGVCTLGPRAAVPAVTESTGALEMSPGVISSDGEQPQTPSAPSRGPEQGSSQPMRAWKAFPGRCLLGGGSWMGFGTRAPAEPWAGVSLQVTKHRDWGQLLPADRDFGSLEQHIHAGIPAQSAWSMEEVPANIQGSSVLGHP